MQSDLEHLFEELISGIIEHMQERTMCIHNNIGVY